MKPAQKLLVRKPGFMVFVGFSFARTVPIKIVWGTVYLVMLIACCMVSVDPFLF